MKKVFISGKITGEPIYKGSGKFLLGQVELGRMGFGNTINPLELDGIHFGISHEEAMKICLKELKTCTHIYMLSDWRESDGAQTEHQFALDNGIEIIYQ